MRILIRTIERNDVAAVVARDRIVESEVIGFGRAADQLIHCNDARIALQHAKFTRAGDALLIACYPPAQAEINGHLQRDATLHVGDRVRLGPILITVLIPPSGTDVALSVEREAGEPTRSDESYARPVLSLQEAGWRQRRWAWLALMSTLLFGLVLPGVFLKQGGTAMAELRQSVWPSDLQWSSGSLHSAHATLEAKCESCHAEPFRRVRNEQCLACHASSLHQHVPATHPATAEQMMERCTTCHVEHDEPAALVQRDTRICTDCHSQPQDYGAGTNSLPVTDFANAHPDFRISLLTAPHWTVSRLRLGESKIDENSNLNFAHATHLDPQGIKAPQGEVFMRCADCHSPRDDGKGFLPVNMEQHCSSCHSLGFDPAEPGRELPHAAPDEVLQTLVDHYSRRFLAGYADPLIAHDRSAPPGAAMTAGARARLLGTARESANRVAVDVFERRVCADCHTVTRSGTVQKPTWTVAPVRLTQKFMPKAYFDHAAHVSGETTCETCHAAATSSVSSDVLMPHIAACRECHGGETGKEGGVARVPSPCASCHVFHDAAEPQWPSSIKEKIAAAAVRR